jgi:hypothetical protein
VTIREIWRGRLASFASDSRQFARFGEGYPSPSVVDACAGEDSSQSISN